jgi:hypothetical protein
MLLRIGIAGELTLVSALTQEEGRMWKELLKS